MSQPSVVVLSYGSGNVRSAVRALERVGADVELTADRAAVENGALCATQFHPEKSGDAGARLLRNWLTTL